MWVVAVGYSVYHIHVITCKYWNNEIYEKKNRNENNVCESIFCMFVEKCYKMNKTRINCTKIE